MSIFGHSNLGLPRMKPLSSKRSHIVSVLDIGSTKVVAMIGRLTPCKESEILPGRTHRVEVIGIGHQRSRGIKSGARELSAQTRAYAEAADGSDQTRAQQTADALLAELSEIEASLAEQQKIRRADPSAERGV